MKNLKSKIVFYILTAAVFYLFPKAMIDTGSAMFILLILIPAAVFIISGVCAVKNGFSLAFTIITEVLFIPTIYIYYNGSAWIYASIYGAISLLGQGAGILLMKILKNIWKPK